jgi:chemotaxis protein methyltransferase CheR
MVVNSDENSYLQSALIEAEIDSVLETIFHKFGYDFRDYSRAHVKRRLVQRMRLNKLKSIGDMRRQILSDPRFVEVLLSDLSIHVTEMFRDPLFYETVREKVVPLLKTWSFIRLWHAGCSTGEEVYSMAILLKEEGLYDRTQIYATDFNKQALQQAKDGIYRMEQMKKYARNYHASGAKSDFSNYYHADYDSAIMDASLKKNIVWANHNLVTDSDFAETHLILCRNVLIYFSAALQTKVHSLFLRSLVNGGVLCLGDKESMDFVDTREHFEPLDRKRKIYRRKYGQILQPND